MPTAAEVHALFTMLSSPSTQPEFWARVSDSVHWWILGHTPMSGTYRSKTDFLDATIQVLADRVLTAPLVLRVVNVVGGSAVDGDGKAVGDEGSWATVEMEAVGGRTRSGAVYDMRYCWVCRFGGDGVIEEVRAYLDTGLLSKSIGENP